MKWKVQVKRCIHRHSKIRPDKAVNWKSHVFIHCLWHTTNFLEALSFHRRIYSRHYWQFRLRTANQPKSKMKKVQSIFFSRLFHLPPISALVCVCVCGSPLHSTGTLSFYHESKCTEPMNYSIGGWVMVDLNLHRNLICRRLVIANMLRFNQFRWDHWRKKSAAFHRTKLNQSTFQRPHTPSTVMLIDGSIEANVIIDRKKYATLLLLLLLSFKFGCRNMHSSKNIQQFFFRLYYFWSYIYHILSVSLSVYISPSIALTLCSLK